MAATACQYARTKGAPASLDERGRESYTLSYRITTDADMAPAAAAAACVTGAVGAPGPVYLPVLWSGYSYKGYSNSYSFLSSRTADYLDQNNSLTEFIVTDTYEPIRPGESPTGWDNTVTPVERPVKYEFDREVYSAIVEHDKDSKAIVNAAGQPYDEPLELEKTRSVLVASYNVPTLAAVIKLTHTYEGAVNDGEWEGLTSRRALCREVTSSLLQNENGEQYYNVRLRIAIHEDKAPEGPNNSDTWDIGTLERGFIAYQVDEHGNKKNPPKKGRIRSDGKVEGSDNDSAAEFATEPFLLAADGTVLPEGQDGVFTFREIRRKVDFNSKVVTAGSWSQTGIVPS